MTRLTIGTKEPLGPLAIDVIGARGQRVSEGLTLSSSQRSTVVGDLDPGQYTFIATRPSGERLIQTAEVGGPERHVDIVSDEPSPREFLNEATQFGLVDSTFAGRESNLKMVVRNVRPSANNAIRSLSALSAADAFNSTTFKLATDLTGGADLMAAIRSPYRYLVYWIFDRGRWRTLAGPTPFDVRGEGEFLRVAVRSSKPLALGLLHDGNLGPIVIVPPFRDGIDVTFLASGVEMDENADRVANPSALRVPVALALPNNLSMADLLVGLTASSFSRAMSVWDNASYDGEGNGDSALDLLLHKFQDPAAACLGALYLARFAPERLPIAWLRNLHNIWPDVAETSLLIAWSRAITGDQGVTWTTSITDHLRDASRARCILFARTRVQLLQLSRLYGPYMRARQIKVSTRRRARAGDFLDYAADAGGLEAFWGRSPNTPGDLENYESRAINGIAIHSRAGGFEQIFVPGVYNLSRRFGGPGR